MTQKVPFKALAFSFTDRAHGRMTVRMKYVAEGEPCEAAAGEPYLLHVEQGPAERTIVNFDRGASVEQASRLCTRMLEAGVFSWEESYPDDPSVGPSRWLLNVVFQPGVFEVHAKGGSMYPAGFDGMMEAFYEIGLPKPEDPSSARPLFPPMPFGAAGAGAGMLNPSAMKGIMDQMQQMFGQAGPGLEELQMVLRDLQTDPARMQELVKSEFRSMSPEERDKLLDMLAATGFGTREWWERFFLD